MTRSLTLRFTPTPDDFARTVQLMTLRRPAMRLLAVLMGASLVGGIYLLLAQRSEASPVAIYALAAPLVYFGYIFWLSPATVKRKVAASERLRAPATWQVNRRGVTVHSAFTDNKVAWGEFSALVELRGFFLLPYRDKPRLFLFIPRRAFSSPEQMQDFRELARQGIAGQ